jgi:MFS family permease
MTPAELKQWKKDRSFFFKFILTAYLLMYMEAGAVPAMLISLADTFDMSTGQQGLLGGIVFLSIAVGGPFAGRLLSR